MKVNFSHPDSQQSLKIKLPKWHVQHITGPLMNFWCVVFLLINTNKTENIYSSRKIFFLIEINMVNKRKEKKKMQGKTNKQTLIRAKYVYCWRDHFQKQQQLQQKQANCILKSIFNVIYFHLLCKVISVKLLTTCVLLSYSFCFIFILYCSERT